MSFYLTFTVGLCVGCCYGDEFLTIVSEQSVLARRSTEELGQWKCNETVSQFNTEVGSFACLGYFCSSRSISSNRHIGFFDS